MNSFDWSQWECSAAYRTGSHLSRGPRKEDALRSFTILTTGTERTRREDSQPDTGDRSDYARWLDLTVNDPAEVLDILTQCPAEEMIAYPVSSLVNNVKNDGPELNGASGELGIAQSVYIARRGTLRCYRKVPLGNQHGVHRPNERKFGKHLSWLRRAKVDRAHLTLTRRIQVRRAAIRQVLCHATMKLTKQELAGIAELTIRHYNQRAEAYWQGTRDHDVSQNIAALLQHIAASAPFAILDLGCGPGREPHGLCKARPHRGRTWKEQQPWLASVWRRG